MDIFVIFWMPLHFACPALGWKAKIITRTEKHVKEAGKKTQTFYVSMCDSLQMSYCTDPGGCLHTPRGAQQFGKLWSQRTQPGCESEWEKVASELTQRLQCICVARLASAALQVTLRCPPTICRLKLLMAKTDKRSVTLNGPFKAAIYSDCARQGE